MARGRSSKSKNPGNFANDPRRASEAGRKAHESGRAHEFTPEEAREAGRKGGQS